MNFTYFASGSPLTTKITPDTLTLIQLEARALVIGVTFFLLNIRDLKISIQNKKHVILQLLAAGEHKKNGISEQWDPKPEAQDPKGGIRDPEPASQVGCGTQDPGP